MFPVIYIEKEVSSHPKTLQILERFKEIPVVEIDRYGEIFNPKKQSFRLQKNAPSLILAKKYREHVLPTPTGYGIGSEKNYYFSHMLNCLYDCRYCFLQGMFRSAHYLFFVNFEDFTHKIERSEPATFFSGYDCDSLAMDHITHFTDTFVPFFQKHPQHVLELRTKSTNIRRLIKHTASENIVVAFTLTPQNLIDEYEHKTPPLSQRIKTIQTLQSLGWPIGLRFDPLIWHENYQETYSSFFDEVFSSIKDVHSVSLGHFRLPNGMKKTMINLYPEEKLFYLGGHKKPFEYCLNLLKQRVPHEKFFPCQ